MPSFRHTSGFLSKTLLYKTAPSTAQLPQVLECVFDLRRCTSKKNLQLCALTCTAVEQIYTFVKHLLFAGQHPAIATSNDIIAENEEFQSARACIQHLQSNCQDLDGQLSSSEKADLVAFSSLIQNSLEPATLYSTWCESESFNQHTQVYDTHVQMLDRACASQYLQHSLAYSRQQTKIVYSSATATEDLQVCDLCPDSHAIWDKATQPAGHDV